MSPKSSTPFIQTTTRDSGWEPENIELHVYSLHETTATGSLSANPIQR